MRQPCRDCAQRENQREISRIALPSVEPNKQGATGLQRVVGGGYDRGWIGNVMQHADRHDNILSGFIREHFATAFQIGDAIRVGSGVVPQHAHRLLVVEVYTPAGNWSSYPPHKHDVHNPPHEVDLEEIYYYRIQRPEGYAIQKVYTKNRRIDSTLTVRDGELVLVPEGYNPVVAAHGYDVYYLNALAGSARSMAASDDPDYAWVRSEWREKDPRLPLV